MNRGLTNHTIQNFLKRMFRREEIGDLNRLSGADCERTGGLRFQELARVENAAKESRMFVSRKIEKICPNLFIFCLSGSRDYAFLTFSEYVFTDVTLFILIQYLPQYLDLHYLENINTKKLKITVLRKYYIYSILLILQSIILKVCILVVITAIA